MNSSSQSSIRVRFAPSPTGHLHIGGLRTAVFNWLFARHSNGRFLIRIEDTDTERSRAEYTTAILDAFTWVNIPADEPMVIQSERLAVHQTVAEQLVKEGKAYKCYCAPTLHGDGDTFTKYSGHCRTATNGSGPFAIRFKVPDVTEIVFHDLIRGPVRFDRDQIDDFIIVRSDGMPVYNFVVVVDDAAMKISYVIRGEDHISNTPKQILLYQACGYTLPQFAHIPMILGPDGNRLSKRDGATSVIEYKNDGYLPDALLNYLVRLGWAYGDQEIFTREELIRYFTLEAVGKKGAIFDREKLNWINSVYIKKLSPSSILTYIEKELDPTFSTRLRTWNNEQLVKAISLYQERVVTLRELMEEILLLHNGTALFSVAGILEGTQTKEILAAVIAKLELLAVFAHDSLAAALKAVAQERAIKFMAIAQPLRIALLGKNAGPGIFELMELLGQNEALNRIKRLYHQL
jgi:glutamyl-tRNA synthetase